MKPFPAERVAKTICEIDDWGVTNLQLQKILYITNLMHAGETQQKLIKDSFYAWDLGPVIPKIYHECKEYRFSVIRNTAFRGFDPVGVNTEEEDALELIQDVAEELFKMPPYELVVFTHREGGAWSLTRKNRTIKFEDILQEYRDFHQ